MKKFGLLASLIAAGLLGATAAGADNRETDYLPVADQGTRIVQPDYPRFALKRKIEGYVMAEYTVDANGRVKDISILASEPSGLFEKSVKKALKQSRFTHDADAAGEPQRITRRYVFELDRSDTAYAGR